MINVQRDKHAQYGESDQSTREDRTDPMDGGVGSPSEPEHGDDQGPGRDDTKL
jgi:hypothetical protein